MRAVIIVLVVIVVAFVAVLVLGLSGGGGDTESSGAPPTKNGEIDEDALGDWKPPGLATLIGKLSAPFAPRLKLANPVVSVPEGSAQARAVPASSERMRIVRVALTSGQGLRIEYACLPRNGRRCPESACVCAAGTSFDPIQISTCPEAWQRKHQPGQRCTADDATAKLVIYPEPGTLQFTPLGTGGAVAKLD